MLYLNENEKSKNDNVIEFPGLEQEPEEWEVYSSPDSIRRYLMAKGDFITAYGVAMALAEELFKRL